ncbi:ZmpA/ZmpB/ZmpC family metallo-endopeptidase-related protein [Endozoicomonas sp. GU-1]|uniref:ZmpA/ZmpB/ZmpC family metallo-endopeptidase-related protein n=1 Tax=Endozoicomonas sp. GU-1 TaxID=3009078 RepID=UPI0022B48766|nr:ZmpA/ZmpB/ZmpC family metallo-endopeptidase-related protein [Endozoicomonas sp. GU-1]WBA82109.1 ZmpA/ZmpB/ZmpC family metallo-endopeptidase-related protein [Endozoicomonas sp. GU-1]
MIRQSGVNPVGMAIDPQPVTTSTTEPEGRWRGWEVIQSGASAFVRSLHPLYDPLNSHRHLPVQDVADSAAGIDPWGVVGQNNNFHQFTALAGRAIAAYSGMPSEINSLLSYLANLAAVGRFASDQLNAFNACGGSIPEPGTHREKTPDETLENTKGKARKASQNLRHQYDKSAAPTLRASQLPNTPLALGALVGLSAVGAASASASDWINVTDAKTLGDICHDAKFPCDKDYRLIDDIDGSQLPRSIGGKYKYNGFTGKLDGNYRTIGNLSKCLVKHLSARGRIENLTLSDANIKTSPDSVGVVACEMSDNAMINNIRVERAHVATNKEHVGAAIGVGKVSVGTITNMTALNCKVKTDNTGADAGIGAGSMSDGIVNNTMAVNCTVETKGSSANAGIGAGSQSDKGTVTSTTALNCTVKTENTHANAGIGVGSQSDKGTVTDTTALSCTVKTDNTYADAGIGAGSSTGGGGTVNNTMAVNCTVETKGTSASAGIGVGSQRDKGTVTDTTALSCTVKTDNSYADAGIGAGSSTGGGIVNNTMAVNCHVETMGESAYAGIGKGNLYGKASIANTRVFYSTVKSENAAVDIFRGSNPVICNVIVNDEQRSTAKGCDYWQNNDVCGTIAHDLAKLKHQIDNYCPNTTIGPKVQKMTIFDPGSATFAAPTPPMASSSPAVIAFIAIVGTVIFVLVYVAYRSYSQRSSTNAGRNRAEPMVPPASGHPRAEGQLPTPPRDRYQPVPFRPRNTRPLPAPPRDHYQPLSFRPRNTRPLPAPPDHYQPLTFRQGNTATGDSNPPVGNEKEPAPPDIPVYLELTEYESIDNHGEPVGRQQIAEASCEQRERDKKSPAHSHAMNPAFSNAFYMNFQ